VSWSLCLGWIVIGNGGWCWTRVSLFDFAEFEVELGRTSRLGYLEAILGGMLLYHATTRNYSLTTLWFKFRTHYATIGREAVSFASRSLKE